MTIFETLGVAWAIFTAALGTVAILYGAYRWFRDLIEKATRGDIEIRRDIVDAHVRREIAR